jgi:PAS domain S-box-containing protein
VGQHVRATDWAATPLGDYGTWPQSLRSALSLVLNTKGVAALYWGEQQWLLYNDAYADALGDRHPWAFGRPMSEALDDIAPVLGPQVSQVLLTGEGFAIENQALTMRRNGRDEDTVWTYSFSPIQGETHTFAGVLLLATEITQQKLAEQSTQHSRKRLETALQVAKLGMYEWNTATGAVDLDARAREIFGFAPETPLLDTQIFARVAPEQESRVQTEALAALEVGVVSGIDGSSHTTEIDYDIVHPDGSRRSIESCGAVIRHEDGTRRMVGTINDVTALKKAEAQLRQHNLTLEEQVAQQMKERDLVWQVNVDMLLVSDLAGVFLSVNPAWTRVLGWTEEELIGRTSQWLEHPEDQTKTHAAIVRLSEGRQTLAFENRFRTREGDYRTLSWTAVPASDKLFCVARDVTQERRQTQALIEQASQLRLFSDIVQASEAPICAFDTELRLIAFNRAHSDEFYRIFAHRVQLGEVFPDLFSADQAPIMRGFMQRALRGESYTVTEEFGDPDLVKPCWEVTYYPLRDPEGRVVGAFHYAKDITTRLRASAELFNTQEALRQSQKMEAVGQLTGGVAHDFNNLLTVIKSATALLKRPELTHERRTRYVTTISDTVDRAAKLTAQLLAFARRQALKPEVFAACDNVRSLSAMMETLTGSQIRIVTELPEQACFVNADASQFDTALVNMAVNARDAMNGQGQLLIRVEPVSQIPAVRAHPTIHGTFVAVSISDTGGGIPAEQLEQIFEPFFTTKAVGQGTGLGLSQVYGFAKQSGGEVRVRSEVGQGSTFTFYLPRVAAPEKPQEPAAPSEPLMDGHGTCVLVVEDNVDVGTFAVQTLRDLGYVPVLASNAQEALAELAKDPDRFDVVFSDVVMPGMSGIELGHEIRRLHHDLPVLLASGYSHVLAQNGTYGFELLHKPYSVEELSRLLRKVATWQRRQRIMNQ